MSHYFSGHGTSAEQSSLNGRALNTNLLDALKDFHICGFVKS